MRKTSTVALLSLFLTGCSVGPKYNRPTPASTRLLCRATNNHEFRSRSGVVGLVQGPRPARSHSGGAEEQL